MPRAGTIAHTRTPARLLSRAEAEVELLLMAWATEQERSAEDQLAIRADPAGWMREYLGADPYEAQVEIAEALRDHRRVTVKGCHSAGKDYITARLVLWFLHAFRPSLVITTGPSQTQVEHVLWRELRTAVAGAKKALLGRSLQVRYEIDTNHYALGFKAADANPERFQGFHGRYPLVIVDEAAGVADSVIDSLSAMMTAEDARMLLIGNPTSTSGRYHESFHRSRELYHCLSIPASRTPNIAAGRTVIPELLTQTWIDEAIKEHGADSPYVVSRVTAEFPDVSDERTLVPLHLIEQADHAELPPSDTPAEAGLDVARFGDDENALCIRRGPHILAEHRWSGMDTMQTVGKVRALVADAEKALGPLSEIKVDVIGLGAGVADRLRELSDSGDFGPEVIDVNVGSASTDPEQYRNLRDELWWNLAQRFKDGLIAGPISERAKGQLSTVRYRYDSRHPKPVIESKDEARKRGIRSPDAAEAILLAFAKLPPRRRWRVLA